MKVTIYSDGGADPNPGFGGWGAVLIAGQHQKQLSGNAPDTTNNRMELTGAIEALKALKRPSEVDFYVDSQYVRRGITEWIEGWHAKGWKRKDGKPVPNVDLWQQLWALSKQHTIEWIWVRGHTGNHWNEVVDKLAREARLEITPTVELSDDVIKLFLRSSCRGNPGPGGWGIVMEYDGDAQQFSGNVASTTNNRMEVTAALEALALLPPKTTAQLFTTSDYLFQGATKWIHGWRKRNWTKKGGQPVANGDLWQLLDERSKNYTVRWVNAKGKQFDGLETAGKLASEAAKAL